MVRLLALILPLLLPTALPASQLDDFLGPADPPYFRRIAPRFIDWSAKNFLSPRAASPHRILALMKDQASSLETWSLPVAGELSWSRLQFGVEFRQRKETSAFIAIFPDHPERLRAAVGKAGEFPPLPASVRKNLIGIGYDLLLDQVFFYSRETLPEGLQVPGYLFKSREAIRRSAYSGLRPVDSALFAAVERPSSPRINFIPLVEHWGIWFTPEGKLLSEDLDLSRFNLHLLDGAAIPRARQVSSEFLLNTLRIEFRGHDDYKIIYP